MSLITTGLVSGAAGAAVPSVTLFGNVTPAQSASAADDQRVEIGVNFISEEAGEVTGVRFFKGSGNTGTHEGHLWSADGGLLATTTFSDESASGWQEARFSRSVQIAAKTTYTVSYLAPRGHYAADHNYFADEAHRSAPLTAPGGPGVANGVYRYGGGFPNSSYLSTNYYVDVLFEPKTVTPPPTTTRPTTTSSTPPPPPPSQVRLRAPDGGANYFAGWPGTLPTGPDYFPVGVWFESVISQSDINLDRAAGINTYVALTANSDLPLIASNNMTVIPQQEEWTNRASSPGSDAIAGWLLYDEIDMIQGPGAGYTTLEAILRNLPADGRLRYNNYGKGVTFWETDAQAAQFVNDYQDFVSADNYWFTDNNICSQWEGGALLLNSSRALTNEECHRASNYGATVDRVRDLITPTGRMPVWNYVELGHPFSQNSWPSIKPAEVNAAVWSSIIHGARGIVYFNHSFGGPNQTQHILRDPAYANIRAAVLDTNQRIEDLAPVLNAPFADNFLTVDGQADAMAKYHDGTFYVFAGSVQGRQTATFSAPCVGNATVTVLDESRTLPMSGGRFTDTFADGNAVHIYRIDGGTTCGLPR